MRTERRTHGPTVDTVGRSRNKNRYHDATFSAVGCGSVGSTYQPLYYREINPPWFKRAKKLMDGEK